MGDMKRKSLEKRATEREAKKTKTVHIKNATIDNLAKTPGIKDKPISARVNGTTYNKFKKICEARGLTPNAALNMLIADFVIKFKNILEQ